MNNIEEYKKELNNPLNINIYPDNWVNYNSILYQDLVEKQKPFLITTGLFNSFNKQSLSFVFDEEMYKLNEFIEKKIQDIEIEDNTISLCNEIYFTSKIEGANTTLNRTINIHNGFPIDLKNYKSEQMVKNCFDATKYLNLCGKLDKQKLLKLSEIINYKICDNKSISGNNYFPYRSGDVYVGNHSGVVFRDVEKIMDMYLEFYNSNRLNNYPFIKAALLHFAFETIHPLPDGNGRVGRLLMNNYLIKQNIDQIKAVSFSHTIDKNRGQYDLAFFEAENGKYNDCTYFLKYMMNTYATTINDILIEKEAVKNKDNISLDGF